MRQAGASDQEAHEAAVAAVLSVWPTQTYKEASAEAVNAIAYATKYHSDWFWRGAQHVGKWRTASQRSPHFLRTTRADVWTSMANVKIRLGDRNCGAKMR